MIAPMTSSPEKAGGPAAKRKTSGVIVPQVAGWSHRLAGWLAFALLRAISASLRYKWHDRSGHFDGPPPGPSIYCVWHNRLGLCMTAYYGFVKKRNRTAGLAAMVSASKDGGFLAGILECFKVQPVRGSSSRRGPQALLELTTWAQRGYDLAITPDGPRGPRYVVQAGVMSLAQVTGLPIVPVSYHLDWKYCLKSWDGFQIPLPFSRCEMFFEKPIVVPRDAPDAEREVLREQLEQVLKEISQD
jgi:lysophospholipid acyltransferase (LPLAT)-like uncharacterized protein